MKRKRAKQRPLTPTRKVETIALDKLAYAYGGADIPVTACSSGVCMGNECNKAGTNLFKREGRMLIQGKDLRFRPVFAGANGKAVVREGQAFDSMTEALAQQGNWYKPSH